MKFQRNNCLLYAITMPHRPGMRPLEEQVREALDAGITMLQLREKYLSEEDFLQEALSIRKLTERYHVPLIINDSLYVAINSGADGIHIGQSDLPAREVRAKLGPDKILGVTAKTVAQAQEAEKAGADYLGSGAVFPSPTKTDAIPMSRETLTAICQSVSIPVVAIGGINASNLSTLAGTGIAGAAVISGIFGQPDIGAAVRELRECIHKNHRVIPTVLTIAGSDSGGGAGIQADLKTITALGLYGTSVITAITAQNTLGVQAVSPASPEILAAQLDSVLSDLTPQAIKIGMLGNKTAVQVVAEKLSAYPDIPVVLDPVLISTSGRPLAAPGAIAASQELLFPRATLLTPNLPEAEFLLQMQTHTLNDDAGIEAAASRLSRQFHTAVLLKGGHRENLPDTVCDVLCQPDQTPLWFSSPRIKNPNNHGTGCTLSSAIACGLAAGRSLEQSIRDARSYLSGALAFGLNLGNGNGPLFHGWNIR